MDIPKSKSELKRIKAQLDGEEKIMICGHSTKFLCGEPDFIGDKYPTTIHCSECERIANLEEDS